MRYTPTTAVRSKRVSARDKNPGTSNISGGPFEKTIGSHEESGHCRHILCTCLDDDGCIAFRLRPSGIADSICLRPDSLADVSHDLHDCDNLACHDGRNHYSYHYSNHSRHYCRNDSRAYSHTSRDYAPDYAPDCCGNNEIPACRDDGISIGTPGALDCSIYTAGTLYRQARKRRIRDPARRHDHPA